MPVYEYECKSCKNKFELMRPFSKSSEGAVCPRCQKKAERVISKCYSMSTDGQGITKGVSGAGSSCASCGSGNCSNCNH